MRGRSANERKLSRMHHAPRCRCWVALIVCGIFAAAPVLAASAAATSQPAATRPALPAPKQLYYDVVMRGIGALPPGFLPAYVEPAGRYYNARGVLISYFDDGVASAKGDVVAEHVREAASRQPAGMLYVIDQEHDEWLTDVRRVTPEFAQHNRDRYQQWADAMRAGNPLVRLAIYDVLPRGETYLPLYRAGAQAMVAAARAGQPLNDQAVWLAYHAFRYDQAKGWTADDDVPDQYSSRDFFRWRAAGDADVAGGLLNAVDAITPTLYLYKAFGIDGMSTIARGNLAEARRLAGGRQIYPFIWPHYHENPAERPTLDEWRAYVRVILENADGCVLWDADPRGDRGYIDVVREEGERATRPTTAPATAPSTP